MTQWLRRLGKSTTAKFQTVKTLDISSVLEEYFGSASNSVVDAINKELAKATKNKTIEKFPTVLNK